MNKEELAKFMEQIGMAGAAQAIGEHSMLTPRAIVFKVDDLIQFITVLEMAEREACAAECERTMPSPDAKGDSHVHLHVTEAAQAIRLRAGLADGEPVRVLRMFGIDYEKPVLEGMTDRNLVERAVRNAINHSLGKGPRWSAVLDTFALGSTKSRELCEAFGLDPDEPVWGVECEACAREFDDGK